jgi:hypothetical protein
MISPRIAPPLTKNVRPLIDYHAARQENRSDRGPSLGFGVKKKAYSYFNAFNGSTFIARRAGM